VIETRPPSVRVRELTRRFGEFVAVDRVSFDVRPGEIFGYLGANGAGKSTTIRILCGLLGATSGEARVAGVDVVHHAALVRSTIGYMSQRFSLYLDLTVRENLEFFGGAYGLFGAAFRARRDVVLRDLDLEALRDQLTGSLPAGLRQRLALACAILHQPRVVFLDEPTAGVDPDARSTFWRLIRALAAADTTIFVTTHYMDEAELCDRVGLMVKGRLAALDTPSGLKRSFVPGRMLEVHGVARDDLRRVTSGMSVREIEPFGAALHLRVPDDGPRVDDIRAALVAAGLSGVAVSDADVTLEDVFLRVVRDDGGAS